VSDQEDKPTIGYDVRVVAVGDNPLDKLTSVEKGAGIIGLLHELYDGPDEAFFALTMLQKFMLTQTSLEFKTLAVAKGIKACIDEWAEKTVERDAAIEKERASATPSTIVADRPLTPEEQLMVTLTGKKIKET
jgi:hypothetical protein